ncbi:hypothetical protein [Achromobacter sp. DH1f]|uniref:hypothetical protein n=1 Tax=Achromobacter sp. DH1f TaxID=1397275 RepID=UPI0018E2E976|nr:hypothetical protein [Achromobacter sp. DH1f]
MREAAEKYDDSWLSEELKNRRLLKTQEERKKPSGGIAIVRVPINAHITLSESEFNRMYVRGICLTAIADNLPYVVVYRARDSENPRQESAALIGKKINPVVLLNDIRSSVGIDTALGVPPGPNSGLSVRIH